MQNARTEHPLTSFLTQSLQNEKRHSTAQTSPQTVPQDFSAKNISFSPHLPASRTDFPVGGVKHAKLAGSDSLQGLR